MKNKQVPWWVSGSLIVGAFGLFYWLERKRPLRRELEPKVERNARNVTVAAVSAAVLQITERPFIAPLCSLVEKRKWGLLKQAKLPAWIEVPLAVMLMDYTLYFWHVLTHRLPWLWRFHVVHHADLDMDASTALRFHFAELSLSVPWRAGQVALIGVSPLSFSVWQTLLFLSILFHHSNVRLPLEIEQRINRFIVTPRMHGIHHSIVRAETDSNWSSGLTIWDWLHGTLRRDVPQDEITIGVAAYREPAEVELLDLLKMPFAQQPPAWQLPNGERPVRVSFSSDADKLRA
jgi:sterol desaturase/sphingolipid hydroxylase (fatty acid hydroxylase superfamily)